MYYLGLDIGSSSIKIALVEIETGKSVAVIQEPEVEMEMIALKNGWAEQDPENWWKLTCQGIKRILKQNNISADLIKGIGISYQMHGLVLVAKDGAVVRNAIIWCDSRATEIGEQALSTLGQPYCREHLLNAPGNFTASKLKWVKENEPELYKKVHKCMLPGDFIAFKLSGNINTTISGLSEAMLWDFKKHKIAQQLVDYYGIDANLIPEIVPTFGVQSKTNKTGGQDSGLQTGTPILYRAGDQPNNALTLNVFQPGEAALTGGTSGVIYAVSNNEAVKEISRINNFAHVNHESNQKRIGKLLCINGAGIQYRWLLKNLSVSSYEEMNKLAASVEVGSDGVCILPFGNGSERVLENKNIGTRIVNINLNNHNKAHLCRAALEGIAFSYAYGMEILEKEGNKIKVMRAGNDNLFRSKVFAETLSTLLGEPIEIYDTTGAIGAARAAVLHKGDYKKYSEYVMGSSHVKTVVPQSNTNAYKKAFALWKEELEHIINKDKK